MLQQTTPTIEPDAETSRSGSTSTSAVGADIGGQTNPPHKLGVQVAWEIEARMLAGQSDEQIAEKLDLPTQVVTEYITTFFDFRADLNRDTWLFLYAVQGPLTPGEELTEGDIWRLLAWLYGPVGVDLIVDDFHGRTDAKNTEATVLAGLLRAQAVVRFVSPRCKTYADALRQIRKRFNRRRDASAKQIVASCDLLLVAAGWNPRGKGRLTSKARREAIDKLTEAQLADQIQKAWDKIHETRQHHAAKHHTAGPRRTGLQQPEDDRGHAHQPVLRPRGWDGESGFARGSQALR